MTSRSESNLTAIMDKMVQAILSEDPEAPSWDDLDMVQRQKIKQAFLPGMMAALDAADAVEAEEREAKRAAGVFTYTVTVCAETHEQAEQVITERLSHDEDYGFEYSVSAKTR